VRAPRFSRRGLTLRAVALRTTVDTAVAAARRTTADGTVALTFDDGPQPGSTDRVLDTLAQLDVSATFFCVGKNARAHPELVQRIRAEGHALGSHSLSHPHPAETPLRALSREYQEGRQAVARAAGTNPVLFRPPHGHLRLLSAAMIRRHGLQPWLWSVDPEDWRPGATTGHIVDVAGQACAGDVVLLHDWIEQPWSPEALDRSATVAALPEIIARIRSRGLVLAALSQ
jgi:peptidoglycan/xylan/chitin deacetylase (PgdA/CDA1 family)